MRFNNLALTTLASLVMGCATLQEPVKPVRSHYLTYEGTDLSILSNYLSIGSQVLWRLTPEESYHFDPISPEKFVVFQFKQVRVEDDSTKHVVEIKDLGILDTNNYDTNKAWSQIRSKFK